MLAPVAAEGARVLLRKDLPRLLYIGRAVKEEDVAVQFVGIVLRHLRLEHLRDVRRVLLPSFRHVVRAVVDSDDGGRNLAAHGKDVDERHALHRRPVADPRHSERGRLLEENVLVRRHAGVVVEVEELAANSIASWWFEVVANKPGLLQDKGKSL